MAGQGDGPTLLVADDEAALLDLVSDHMQQAGFAVLRARDGQEALQAVQAQRPDALLLDLQMPRRSGLEVIDQLAREGCLPPTVAMTAHASLETALAALRLGASDLVTKPFRMAEAELKVRLALERGRAVRHERSLPPVTGLRQYLPPLDPAADPPLHGLVGRSPAMQQLFRQIDRVARFGSTVLITGESGTGKELVARALHAASPRARAPFVAVNCGAIPENLLESELFGHVRGAFTDASADRRGLFEEAHGGTLLLDEITDLPLHLQVKLLRVLQEGEIRKVGGNRAQAVDVRVVAASAVPVRARVAEGRFREDLYYRLAVIELALPPLRVRGDDLPLLVHHLIGRTNQRLGTRVTAIEPAALALLQARPWPGNVRELHNVIEQACVMAEGPQLTAALFAEAGQQGPDQQDLGQHDERHDPSAGTTAAALAAAQESAAPPSLSIPAAVSAIEARLIREALTRTGGNRTQAAALLAISPRNLHDKIRQYAIGMAAPHGRPRRKPATTGQGETP